MPQQHRYGWVPDAPDPRDLRATFPWRKLPARVDNRQWCPPVWNQLELGSCTAQAIAAAIQYLHKKQDLRYEFTPSRLFIYYCEREIEGTLLEDAGAMIRTGVKAVNRLGACPESDWPYLPNRFAIRPAEIAYKDAVLHKALRYERVPQSLRSVKSALADGYPVVFGFSVCESFEGDAVAETGIVRMPAVDERVLGAHAVLAVGYDDARAMFTVRNSWGANWGDRGYFYMPYDYLANNSLADDFWMIKLVR